MENNFCDISVDDFVELFRNAQVMHSTRVKILKTHFQCTEHTATARQLSELLGYKNFNAVNLQYGLFVKSLALEFGISKNQQNFDWLFFLMDFIHQPNEECKLRLRENTVQALRKIGW